MRKIYENYEKTSDWFFTHMAYLCDLKKYYTISTLDIFLIVYLTGGGSFSLRILGSHLFF
jgi:hypothetical protein